MYDLSGPENADNQCDPTKIVDTESGNGSLFAAVKEPERVPFSTRIQSAFSRYITLLFFSGKERPCG